MTTRKALYWTIFWISIAMLFNLGVYLKLGQEKAIQFLTGYIIEESLSVDNLFVFLVLFKYFKIPDNHQRRILNWGVVGVIILRGIFIIAGSALVTRFGYVMYLFGAILIWSGYKMVFSAETDVHPEKKQNS